MRLTLVLCVVTLVTFALLGCSPERAFVESMEAVRGAVDPEYMQYVEKDTTLSDAEKERRKRTSTKWRETIKKYLDKLEE